VSGRSPWCPRMNCLWSITGLRRLVGAARVHACVPTSAPTPAGVGTRAGSWAIASRAFESLAQPGSRGRFSRGAGGGDSDSDTEASQQQQQQQQQLGYSASQFRYFHEHAIKLLADREHGQGELRQKLVNLCFQKRRRLLRRLERRQQRNPRWNIKTRAFLFRFVSFRSVPFRFVLSVWCDVWRHTYGTNAADPCIGAGGASVQRRRRIVVRWQMQC